MSGFLIDRRAVEWDLTVNVKMRNELFHVSLNPLAEMQKNGYKNMHRVNVNVNAFSLCF